MSQNMLHFALAAGLIGLGVYLFDHPHLRSKTSRLVRGVVIWIVLVLGLRALDYMFLP